MNSSEETIAGRANAGLRRSVSLGSSPACISRDGQSRMNRVVETDTSAAPLRPRHVSFSPESTQEQGVAGARIDWARAEHRYNTQRPGKRSRRGGSGDIPAKRTAIEAVLGFSRPTG